MRDECRLVQKAWKKVYNWIDCGLEFPEELKQEITEHLIKLVARANWSEQKLIYKARNKLLFWVKDSYRNMYELYEDLEDDELYIEFNELIKMEAVELVEALMADLDEKIAKEEEEAEEEAE